MYSTAREFAVHRQGSVEVGAHREHNGNTVIALFGELLELGVVHGVPCLDVEMLLRGALRGLTTARCAGERNLAAPPTPAIRAYPCLNTTEHENDNPEEIAA